MRREALVLLLLFGCGLDESGVLGEPEAGPVEASLDASVPDVATFDAPIEAAEDAPDEPAPLDAGVDAPYDAGPILTITGGSYELLDLDAGVCSKTSSNAASFTLQDDRDASVDLVWVDFNCAEQPYGTIAPGGNKMQNTYVTHVWRVRDDASKAFLAGFVLESPNTFTVTVH